MNIAAVDYDGLIPNNVALGQDVRVKRALEKWHPGYLNWWNDMGPEGFQESLVYLRTAVSVDPKGWAKFDYVRMPEYRWGVLLAPQMEGRKVNFGTHKGEPAWQDVPGEYRAMLRRLVVIQGDTEPASVEQQRHLGKTAPSLYDMVAARRMASARAASSVFNASPVGTAESMAVRPQCLKSRCAALCCRDAASRILLGTSVKHAISIMSNKTLCPEVTS